LSNIADQVLAGGLLLTGKLQNQWFLMVKLKSSLRKFQEVLETRQEEFAEELSQQVTIARQIENIIRQIITDLIDKQDKINTELMIKTQILTNQLAQTDQVLAGGLLLTGKLQNQWFLMVKLKSSLRKF
jgi:glutaredoxin 2